MEKSSTAKPVGCKIYRILVFVLPLLYSLQTRFLLRSKLGVVVWGTEYLIPIILTMLILGHWHLYVIDAIISIVAVYNLYEIGYIQNDCETIKHECHPTMRHTKDTLQIYEKWKFAIYLIRILVEVGLSYYLYEIAGISALNIVLLWLIIPLYLLYNGIRNRINLYLIALLTTYRYCFPIYLYGNITASEYLGTLLLVLFFVYPFPKFIEICVDGKGNSPEKWAQLFLLRFEERFLFRVKYYIIMLIISLVLAFNCVLPYIVTIIPLYFFIIRIPQVRMKKIGKRSL